VASKKEGVEELKSQIHLLSDIPGKERKAWLLAEKAYQLIKNRRMKNVDKAALKSEIEKMETINLYQFVESYEAKKA
jgi:LAO/AO transport system kinase